MEHRSMTALRPFAIAAAIALSAGAASAQTPYGSPQQEQQQPTQQGEAVRAILGALFGDRLGNANTSLDGQWALGRMPLAQQQTQFDSRIEAEVRARRLSQYEGERARYDYRLLVDLEARYGADRRFTAQERAELNERYATLTQVITQGGYDDDGGNDWASLADGRLAFETRVDAAVRARRLSRTEGTRLKTDYIALVRLESDYRRDGRLDRREREDLETRLDALDQRVGDVGYGGGQTGNSPEARLDAIARALPRSGLNATAQAQLRVEHEDLTRLAAAYARFSVSADDRAYLERRLLDLETRVRIRR